MPNTFLKGICTAAIAITLTANAALTGNHNVLIEAGGFFPPISYVGPGDSLVFTNNSEVAHILQGPDGTWTSTPIPVGGTFVLPIDSEMPKTYSSFLTVPDGDDEDDAPDELVLSGEFTFEPAPLDGPSQ